MEQTTNQKGLITELKIQLAFTDLGYNVCIPLNSDSRYDCIADIGGRLIRIQIKTSRESKTTNAFTFNCKSVKSGSYGHKTLTYSSNDVDFFGTVWNDKVYLVPVSECSTEKTLHLTPKGEKPVKNWAYAEDYLIQEVLKKL